MKIERIITKQGHPVPSKAHRPNGPFPPELLQQPRVIYDYVRQGDDGHVQDSIEGTAQDNFAPVRWFRCDLCGDRVPESQLETHICNGEI